MGRQYKRLRAAECAAGRCGITVVELALVAPVLLLIVLGLFEIGHAFMVQHFLSHAAREGCREAVVPGRTNAQVLTGIDESLHGMGIHGAETTILVNHQQGEISQAKAGDEIRVSVKVSTANVSVIPRSYLDGQLTSTCVRRRE